MYEVLKISAAAASWPFATVLMLLVGVCLLNNGLTAKRWSRYSPPPPSHQQKAARVASSIAGGLLSLASAVIIVFGVVLPQGVAVSFSLADGTQIDIPAKSVQIPGSEEIIVEPEGLTDLANRWEDLSGEARRSMIVELLASPPDDTRVWFKPSGSDEFEMFLWEDLRDVDRGSIIDLIKSPDVGLDFTTLY